MAINDIFKPRVLTAAVNKIKPVTTKIVDKVFSRKSRQLSDAFVWDIKSGSEKVMRNIRVHEPATVADNTGRKAVTCRGPRFSEKRFISAADLNVIERAYGSNAVHILSERIGDEQFDMRAKVDRTREFMAAKCLAGQVVDESGAVIVDFNFPAAQKPVLAGAAKWSDAAGKPIKNLRNWKKMIAQAMGNVDGFTAFCGSDAMDALLENASVQEQLKYTTGSQIAEQGRIAHLAGVEIEEYFGSYIDSANARQDFIPPDSFVLVGIANDAAAELYAPVVDLESETGVGKGREAELFFSKSWEEKDPSGRWIKVEARPLPVLYKPEIIVYAKVV